MADSLPDIYPNDIGDEIYEGMQPLIDTWGDPDQHLWIYLHALGQMLQPIDDISKDGPNGEPGWSQIFDLERMKTEWLPWAGQLVGYEVPPRPSWQPLADYDAMQRERIVTRSAYRRGTTQMLVDVIKEHLGGTQYVAVQERYNNDRWLLNIWILNAEILDSMAEILKAANKVKAAGIILSINGLSGPLSYDNLRASNATYAIVKGKFTDYTEVRDNPVK